MKFDAFVGGSYALPSVQANCQRAVNLYPELDETGQGKNKFTYVGTPGVHLFGDVTDFDALVPGACTPIRGLFSGGGRLWVAAGTRFFEVDGSGPGGTAALKAGTSVHTIADDADHSPVQIFSNGRELFVIASGRAYRHDGVSLTAITFDTFTGTCNTNGTAVTWVSGDKFDVLMQGQTITINAVTYTVTEVASETALTVDAGAGVQAGVAFSCTPALKAVTGGFLDGYFITNAWIDNGSALDANWNRFYVSELWSGASPWDGLRYDVKSGHPDNLVAVHVDGQYLWLFGSQTAEAWANNGNPDFPFARVAPVIQQGCLSPWSPVSLGGMIGWIGMDARGGPVAYLAEGFQPRRVSTHAVEYAWRTMSPSQAARKASSFAYTQQGHLFWVINFPGTNPAWVYDVTTGIWHERAAWNSLIPKFSNPMYRYHTFLAEWEDVALTGVTGHIVGDPLSGNLYHLSPEYYDDNGSDIKRRRTAPHLSNENRENFYHRMEIDADLGGISKAVYVPTGPAALNDAVSGGTYTGTASTTFTVQIDAAGTPDTFKWRKSGGAWTAGVAITGATQTLSDGVTVRFYATTGHAVGDAWTIAAEVEPASVTLSVSRNGGKTFGTAKAVAPSAPHQDDRGKRFVWRRIGGAHDLVPQVDITGKSKVAIFNAYLELSKGGA
ncbi:MAG: hypothetical protein LLG20_18515 [Acidobacteriales bacterium]|nr:hypothetical protein [Terriglobales bacterium]